MSISPTAYVAPHIYRRVADNTPLSRVRSEVNQPPTSPKMHEIREKYESLKAAMNGADSALHYKKA
ncbi:conserved hypothetical protein [Sideroxydans lithotrophicus ES-1]|uniref:Uncharacterized protein n=1 Tax=Sideroxydans lithotrophicus (strain ES-1) TaxID=580332 RepID=D5CS67_SIDLE|nr:conserved hypothetical protein [Sideroxydans lithotrophicus ES-1]